LFQTINHLLVMRARERADHEGPARRRRY
jgi:hypothetical protein